MNRCPTRVVFNQVISRTKVAREALEALEGMTEDQGAVLLETRIHSRVAWKMSSTQGLCERPIVQSVPPNRVATAGRKQRRMVLGDPGEKPAGAPVSDEPHLHPEVPAMRFRPSQRVTWLLLGLFLTVALGLLPLFVPQGAEAQIGGLGEVRKLELRYSPGDRALQARFHLASGLALDQHITESQDIDRLLSASVFFAQPRTRMFITAEEGEVVSWHLSVS